LQTGRLYRRFLFSFQFSLQKAKYAPEVLPRPAGIFHFGDAERFHAADAIIFGGLIPGKPKLLGTIFGSVLFDTGAGGFLAAGFKALP